MGSHCDEKHFQHRCVPLLDAECLLSEVGLPPMPTEMWCMVFTMCSQAGMMPSPEIDPEWVYWACVPTKEFTDRFPYSIRPSNAEFKIE
eukprot:m.236172 g.236172  ORF g.236172 m.236172 type:complete len:89 (+) comp15773_c0_seq2:1013-1279(+)